MRFNNFWDYRRILFSKGFASAVWHSRKNVLAYGQGRPMAAGPYMAELDVTYRCNCRCQMCQRWQDPRNNELRADEYETLAGVLHDMGSHQISVAGGEPLMQPSFLIELLKACGDLDLHRTVDTCGFADTRTLLKIASHVDLFLYDLKHMDPEIHYRHTGVSNQTILTNLKCLSRQGAKIIIRLPLIPGINNDEENIERTGAFISSLAGVNQVHILPYHRAAEVKYERLGMKSLAGVNVERPPRDHLESIVRRLEKYELQVEIGG